MNSEKLEMANKLDRKIRSVEDVILEIEKYQKLLKGRKIENITITYKEEGNCHLFSQEKIPVKLIHEMNEKWLNELNNELKSLLKEFKEL